MNYSDSVKENLKKALSLNDNYFQPVKKNNFTRKISIENQKCAWCLHFMYIHESCGTNIHSPSEGCICDNKTPISVCTISYDIDGPINGYIQLCAANECGCENFEVNPTLMDIKPVDSLPESM